MKKVGFTNIMCAELIFLLLIDTILGFILSLYSIQEQYMGALPCFTVIVTPINAGVSFVLNRAVKKSEAENTGPNNEGINYQKYLDGVPEI